MRRRSVRLAVLSIIAIAAASCAHPAAVQLAPVRPDDDMLVWAAALDAAFSHLPASARLMVASTTQKLPQSGVDLRTWVHGSAVVDSAYLSSLRVRNARAQKVAGPFATRLPVQIYDAEAARKVHATAVPPSDNPFGSTVGIWYARLHKAYPGVWGLVTLTEPGYSNDRDIAVVYLMSVCSLECGQTELFVLRRTGGGGWRVIERHLLEVV